MVEINFKNMGKVKIEEGSSILEALKKTDKSMAGKAVVAEMVDGEGDKNESRLVDLDYRVEKDSFFNIITTDDEKAGEILNHSTSHIMATAIKRVFSDAKFAIGPSIKDGFYYDFETSKEVSEEDLPLIEKEMKNVVNSDYRFERKEISKEEALKLFKDNEYKIELINGIKAESVSIYKSGEFIDLCSGPHIPSTGKAKAFKLLSVAGAYWRGDEKNRMLTRIYGTSFFKKNDLKEYLEKIELAKRSDHRKIGKELDLFSFHEEAPGFPFFHPQGKRLIDIILDYWKEEHRKEGYMEVNTPIILSNELWKASGHWDNYKENMYFVKIDEGDFAVKPMNCPGHIIIYKSNQHSYRELPIKMAELGLVHRHEKSGVLHGLFRVRSFTQDDAHIFCTEEQAEGEIQKVISLIERMYRVFGFDKYKVEISTRPDKRIGSDEMWDMAEDVLKKAVSGSGLDFIINEGDGAFYGPKIDFHIMDCLGRTWQCGTIQLDFAMPEKIDVEYIGEDNTGHRPVMIHRTVMGSIERFLGIILEHYSGNLPLWLAPRQIIILPISEKYYEYAKKVYDYLKNGGFRIGMDNRVESLSKKIRQAEVKKIPYMIVVGENEEKTGTITIRKKTGGDIREIKLKDFEKELRRVVDNKEIKY
ncbi:MAG: threonine--tRNA ligase [Actinomycetota bacterium]|nr:threonine--tRNA ligase [Actinomycetota bacterium]